MGSNLSIFSASPNNTPEHEMGEYTANGMRDDAEPPAFDASTMQSNSHTDLTDKGVHASDSMMSEPENLTDNGVHASDAMVSEPETATSMGSNDADEEHIPLLDTDEKFDNDWIPKNICIPSDTGEPSIPQPTNAYGHTYVKSHRGCTVSRYCRLDVNTEPKQAMKLLTGPWKLHRPTLLFSVTEEADHIKMDHKSRITFCRGLTKAAHSAGGWIVTGGTHTGQPMLTSAIDEDVVVIGITTWGCICEKNQLINTTELEHFSITETVPLAPHHTHFLLVDDGKENTVDADIKFRVALEQSIFNMGMDDSRRASKIPIVLIVVGGGRGTPMMVSEAVKRGSPIVVIKGSGGYADTLAGAMRTYKLNQKSTIPKDEIPEDTLHEHNAMHQDIMKNQHLLTVFELSESNNFDVAVLKALMKATDNINDRLSLMMDMDWMDVTREYVFADSKISLTMKELEDWLEWALKNNRPQFVEFFLDQGISLYHFITADILKALYNSIGKNEFLYKLFKGCAMKGSSSSPEEALTIEFEDVDKLLASFFKVTVKMHDMKEISLALFGPKQLFIWSVLMCRHDIAPLLWARIEEPLAFSLIANFIYQSMSKRCTEFKLKAQLEKNAKWFEEKSDSVLKKLYLVDEEKTKRLFYQEIIGFCKAIPRDIAVFAENKKCVSSPAYKALLTDEWRGSLANDYSFFKIVPCWFLPPLICYFINVKKYGSTTKQSLLSAVIKRENSKFYNTNMGLLKEFYTAPVVIFCLHVVFYVAYLALFSYVMITLEARRFPSLLEIVLIVWTSTFALEELIQIKRNKILPKGFKAHFRDRWNQFDIAILCFFVLGMSLRFTVDPSGYIYGKVVLALDLLLCFMRMLHVYSFHKIIGPMLAMIQQMAQDLIYFMAIMLLFVVAYAIVSESILDVHGEITAEYIFLELFRKAYFHIYGELFLEEYTEHRQTNRTTNIHTSDSEIGKIVVMYLMGVYMIVCNIILLNLLIAMFSDTYAKIQVNTHEHFHWQRQQLVKDYSSHSPFPPPFNIGMIIIWGIQKVHGCFTIHTKKLNPRERYFQQISYGGLLYWEMDVLKPYIQWKAEENNQQQLRTLTLDMGSRIEHISQMNEEMKDKISLSEQKNTEILQLVQGLAHDISIIRAQSASTSPDRETRKDTDETTKL